MTGRALAADEDAFLSNIQPPSVQTVGNGRSVQWTLPLVATQYQPSQPTPAMQAAIQAQRDGRFLDALIILDEAGKKGQVSADTQAEMGLLRSSFLLQGNQTQQSLDKLAPLLANPKYAADAFALTAMTYVQQGKMQQALDAAQHAHGLAGDLLPHLALSYALQGSGRLTEARDAIHDFNSGAPQSAVALAREAELDLTLNQAQSARMLVGRARDMDATSSYVIAVSGLAYLIDGNAAEAKTAFETALKSDPKDARALLGLGLAEIKLGDFQAGQERIQAANEADPGNSLILTYLGRVQLQLGQTEAARASWHSAQQADPKDPIPWLYQAQMELQANHPLEARENLRQAQVRTAYRSVYRGEQLLKEDEQLLQVNLAETQRQLGLENLALHSLTDSVEEKNSNNLRAQADILQGQRFGETARRSLLLQSQFNDRPGNIPSELDIYGDGAALTGAQLPQHGVVSLLSAQQASYNNYDSLFSQRTTLVADEITGSQGTQGAQVRAGGGSDTLGVSIAWRNYMADGMGPFPNLLNNDIAQGIVQWRPERSTQVFMSYQTFYSLHGETAAPWDTAYWGTYHLVEDNSSVLRLGLRQALSDNSEVRGLISRQQTDLTDNAGWISFMAPYSYLYGFGAPLPFPQYTVYGSNNSQSAELQYRVSGADSATQWGASQYYGPDIYSTTNFTRNIKQVYAARQQMLNPHWQLDAQLAWENMDIRDNTGNGNDVSLERWLPKLGLIYTPDDASHVRLAGWQDIYSDMVGGATLAPVSVAGIVTKRPDERNNLVQSVALGADRQLNSDWLLDGQAQRHIADQPGAHGSTTRKKSDESRLALHWQPGSHSWVVSLAYEQENVQAPPLSDGWALDSVQEQRLRSQQLDLRWFASEQWTVHLDWSHNLVAATMQTSIDPFTYTPILIPYQESFDQMDASLDWQFNKAGSMNIGVRNATDKHFLYTNLDPLNPRFSTARLVYARLKFAM